MIRAVIFDFGKVLYDFDNNIFFNRLIGRQNKRREQMVRLYLDSDLQRQYETGELSTREFCQRAIELCQLEMTEEHFADAFARDKCWPIPGREKLVRRLDRNSYLLGLLSNTNELDFVRTISLMPIYDLFSSVTLSFELGAMKPSPLVYQDALEKIRMPPGACVFVDDIEENVAGAVQMGMHGIHQTPENNLEESLNRLGVRT